MIRYAHRKITSWSLSFSEISVEDTKMRFSLTPQPGESGFIQWLDAMKMVARLQGGIPFEFRKRVSAPRSTTDNEFD